MGEISIDIDQLVKQLKNEATLAMVKAICPDDDTRDFMIGFLNIFIKHDIPAETAMAISMDLVKLMNEKGENKGELS